MENNPFDSHSSTPSKEGLDKPTKKKSLRVPFELPTAKKSAEIPAAGSAPKEAEGDLFKTATKNELASELPADSELEKTTTEEAAYTQQQIAAEHLSQMEQADPQTAEQLAPAVEFLQRVNEGSDTETAFREVANELGMDEAEINEVIAQDSQAAELGDNDEQAPEQEPALMMDTVEDSEGEVDLSRPTTPPPMPSRAGSGSGGTVPPRSTPASAAGPFPGSARPPIVSPAGQMAKHNVLPSAANTYYNQRAKAGELLVVGIVGYLIGRRRGRIKTEKRLLPVQQKLKKQVAQLEQNITHKEQQLVAAKARLAERPATAVNANKVTSSRLETPASVAVERTQPGLKETRLGMEKPVRVEHLGHMIVTAEAPRSTGRAQMEKPKSIRQAFRPEEVKTMQRNDLLELSEKIIVEGASLRRIYESRLIGEKQLRHLVSEYLQGKDIHKDLRREMVEHEIDFERDPMLRDRVRSHLSSNKAGGGLGDLLASVGIVDKKVDAELERRVAADEKRQADRERKSNRQRVVADTAMATAVVVLAIVVLILATRQ